MAVSPALLVGPPNRAHTAIPTVVHFALTRSAMTRLAPVAEALGGFQPCVDPTGTAGEWSGEPIGDTGELSAALAARSAAAALDSVRPDVALVAGDSDLALACTLAATRVGVPVARIGAGLRSGDHSDPREINRVAIDELAARLYVDDADAGERLLAEGLDERRLKLVGSTIPDVVRRWYGQARDRAVWRRLDLRLRGYVVVDLKKPQTLSGADRIADGIAGLAQRIPVVVRVQPAGRAALDRADVLSAATVVAETREYVDFLSLLAGAAAVVADSSGVQEETTVLGIPCFTLGHASERTLTLTHGTNALLGDDGAAIADVLADPGIPDTEPIPLWDGAAGRRIATDLARWAGNEDR